MAKEWKDLETRRNVASIALQSRSLVSSSGKMCETISPWISGGSSEINVYMAVSKDLGAYTYRQTSCTVELNVA